MKKILTLSVLSLSALQNVSADWYASLGFFNKNTKQDSNTEALGAAPFFITIEDRKEKVNGLFLEIGGESQGEVMYYGGGFGVQIGKFKVGFIDRAFQNEQGLGFDSVEAYEELESKVLGQAKFFVGAKLTEKFKMHASILLDFINFGESNFDSPDKKSINFAGLGLGIGAIYNIEKQFDLIADVEFGNLRGTSARATFNGDGVEDKPKMKTTTLKIGARYRFN